MESLIVLIVFVVVRLVWDKVKEQAARPAGTAGPERRKTPPSGRAKPFDRPTPRAAASSEFTPRPAADARPAGEGHVTTFGASRQARLEQLDTLLEAGLLDKEEYREKKRQIEGEGR